MHKQLRRRAVFATLLLTVLASLAQGEPSRAPSNPATGFSSKANITSAASTDLSGVVPLKQHGNGNGGQDYGYHNVGVVFGAKVYSGNFAVAMELYYYIPSQPDYLYREGDYRGSTGRIGNNTGSDGGEYYCPEGYAAVGYTRVVRSRDRSFGVGVRKNRRLFEARIDADFRRQRRRRFLRQLRGRPVFRFHDRRSSAIELVDGFDPGAVPGRRPDQCCGP